MTFKNQFGTINIFSNVLDQIIGYYIKKCFGVKKIKYKNFFKYDFLIHKLNSNDSIQDLETTNYELSITISIYVQYGVNISELCKSMIKELKYEMKEISSINLKNINITVENINN